MPLILEKNIHAKNDIEKCLYVKKKDYLGEFGKCQDCELKSVITSPTL